MTLSKSDLPAFSSAEDAVPRDGLAKAFDPAPARPARRTWAAAIVGVTACHLGLLLLLRDPAAGLEAPPPSVAVAAEIVEPFRPPPPEPRTEDPGAPAPAAAPTAAPTAAMPAQPAPPSPLPPPRPVRAPRPPAVEPRPTPPAAAADPDVVLGASALAGAAVAGTGAGGNGLGGDGDGSGAGACDMIGRLQAALRQDADIRAAVARAHAGIGPSGRAILVWNGEWLRNPGQDGKGLAGVRQAIAMEVAFAPEACRSQRMRGLVLISFSDRPGGPALALGARDWRWTELLAARR